MRSNQHLTRRTVLTTAGALVLGTFAGCSSSNGAESGSGGSSGGDTTTEVPTSTPAETAEATESVPASFDGWFDGVSNYDGSVVDATGQSEVEVTVGAQGNGGNFAFDPPAVRVSSGTTVAWTWTGAGGSHNVAAEDGSFESELVTEEGHTFTHTFEEAGTYRYVCTPHRSLGMKGAVVVG